jgi:hypothetical protein
VGRYFVTENSDISAAVCQVNGNQGKKTGRVIADARRTLLKASQN